MPELIELTPELRKLLAQIAAHTSWANTPDRSARTANARRAFEDKFLTEADGDPKRAESLRKAYYAKLALRSAQARRRRAGHDATERNAVVVETRIAELDGGDAA